MNSQLAQLQSQEMTDDRVALAIAKELLRAVDAQAARLDKVEGRMQQVEHLVESEVKINSRQAVILNLTVKARVRELLPEPEQYKSLSKKFFQALWREVHVRFAVPNYREIPRKEFQAAVSLVKDWMPVTAVKAG